MRTIKELLQLILNEGNENFKKGDPESYLYVDGYKGLCGFVDELHRRDIINFYELQMLDVFIASHKPKNSHEAYYWACGEWTPRKKWLEKHIKNIE